MADDPAKNDPPQDPPADPPQDPPPAPAEHHCTHCGVVDAMRERLDTMENHIQTILDVKPDSTPVKGPWYARKIGGR